MRYNESNYGSSDGERFVGACLFVLALYVAIIAVLALLFQVLWNVLGVSGVINEWGGTDLPAMTFKVAFVIVFISRLLFGGSSSK